jgi:hypothetical protein
MPRFEVFSSTTAIGYSELEAGDPPMGVAGGRFIPLPAYEAIQPMIVAARESSQECFALTVRMKGGLTIQTQGGVHITDYSAELGHEGIQLEVMGITYPPYDELFPGRHAGYVARFSGK